MKKLILLLFWSISAITHAQTPFALQMDSLLGIYTQSEAPGMAIGIIKDGKTIYKNAAGMANLEHQIPITDSTVFNIASISKQFAALLTLFAEQEKKLTLDDDIRDHLPELKHLPNKITIRQLANHTHGLPNSSELLQLKGFGLDYPMTNAEALEVALSIQQPNFEAGSQFQYGNVGYLLVAEILARAYEKPFTQLIQEKIFGPLQMNHSQVVNDPYTIVPNLAEAYQSGANGYIKFPNRQMESGPSNVHITLNDFIKWATNFQQPSIGNPSMYTRMIEPGQLNHKERIGYGLGLNLEIRKGVNMAFHGGGTAGYRAYILHVPSQNISVVTLGNRKSFESLQIAYQAVDLLCKDQLIETVPQKTNYTSEELQKWTGVYKLENGNYVEITEKDQTLFFGPYNQPDQALPLTTIGDQKFDFTYIPTTTLTFYDGYFKYRIADFTYTFKRTTLNPPKLSVQDLKSYVGVYKNRALNTMYEIVLENDQLVVKHLINSDIYLNPLKQHVFYSNTYFFERLDFIVDQRQRITGFTLAGMNLNNLHFEKVH